MSLYSRLDRLAADVEKLDRKVDSVSNAPQSQRTSVEGGSIGFNDEDGNLKAIVGGQDDGGTTINVIAGPTPPTPVNYTVDVDHGSLTVHWDGDFEGDVVAPTDWARWTAYAQPGEFVVPERSTAIGGTDSASGGEVTAGVLKGQWTVTVLAWSQAGKPSAMGLPVTVDVPGYGDIVLAEIDAAETDIKNAGEILVTEQDTLNDKLDDAFGQIEDAIVSANGKNTVHFEDRPPTTADPGIDGDTWYMGRNSNLAPPVGAIPSSWSLTGGAYLIDWETAKDGKGVRFPAESSGALHGPFLPTVPGEVWDMSVYAGRYSGSTATANIRCYFYTSASAYITSVLVTSIGSGFASYSGTATAPANAAFARYGLVTSAGGAGWLSACDFAGSLSGLSKEWNVTEQYRHDGTGWKRVELSHEVISSMDVGKLVAGNATIKEAVVQKLWAEVVVAKMVVAEEFIGENAILTGAVTAPKITASEELWAKIGEFVKIRAEQIEADAIDGKVITGPIIQSARTGQRWVGDTTGIRIFNADNEVRTKLSPDDSVFRGEVEADTLIVNGGSELRSTENKLGQGAKLTLESGVTDPTAPPVVQPYWDSTDFDTSDTGTQGVGLRGLAWDGTYYWTTYAGNLPEIQFSAFRINPADGSVSRYHDASIGNTTNASEWFGVTCIGSELFWLYRSGYTGFVLVTDLNRVKKREWEYEGLGYSKTNPLKYRPGIGNDGTNVVIAQCNDAGLLFWNTYNKTTGALLSTVDETGTDASDMSGVYIGTGDWGVTRVVVAKTKTRALVAKTTSGVFDEPRSWGTANDKDSTGVVFADGKFRTLDPSGAIHEYADNNTGDKSGDWWATYRWALDEDDNGVNDSSSRIGPVKQFTWPHRARLKFLGAPLPDGVGYTTPSIAKNATKPARTDFRTPVFVVHEGTSTAMLDTLPTDWLTGASPSDVNSFPNAEPSTLASSSNTFEVNGDGSGRWGPLTFNADGTMSSTAVPAWVPVTTFASGYGPQTWGFAPAYRVWPDGKVEWRGVIAGDFGATVAGTKDPLTIPTAARATQPVNVTGASTGGGSLVKRIEFGQVGTPSILRVYHGDTPGGWVSLEGIYYYKS